MSNRTPKNESPHLQQFLSHLNNPKYLGSGRYQTKCPVHDGKGSTSLSITTGDDGRILLKCFAGCTAKDIVKAVGLELKDLFPPKKRGWPKGKLRKPKSETPKERINPEGLTLEEYGSAKRLSIPFLKELGLESSKYKDRNAVIIRYRDRNGRESIRYRLCMEGDNRFRWKTGSTVMLYGLWFDYRPEYVVLAEGESDAQTLWYHDYSAYGIPGASNLREDRDTPHLEIFKTIFFMIEQDQGGEAVKEWIKTLPSSTCDRVKLVYLEEGVKDISDLHVKDPGAFKDAFDRALKAAIPWATYEREQKERGEDEKIQKLLDSETEHHPLYSAQEWDQGHLVYGTVVGREKVLVQSDGEILIQEENDGLKFTSSKLRPSVIKRFKSNENINGKILIERLSALFSDHIFFKDQRIPIFLAVWVISTYSFKLFTFFGYLWITSLTKRCGKSLLLDVLSALSFNATERLINPSEAYIFREVDQNSNTLILDEVESLRNEDRETFASLMSLLNSGFQSGSKVGKVEKKGGAFLTVTYSAYSPKVLSGINAVSDTVEDRSFKIVMVRKTKDEQVSRFNYRKEKERISTLVEDMYLWTLKTVGDVSDVYENQISEASADLLSILNDRELDIWEPLLSVALVIDLKAETGLHYFKLMASLARDMSSTRSDSEADGTIPSFVSVLEELIPSSVENRFVVSEDLLKRIQEEDGLSYITHPRQLRDLFRKFGPGSPISTLKRINGGRRRGYEIRREWVEEIRKRYV